MSSPTHSTASSLPGQPLGIAVLVLDTNGAIVLASNAACAWWRVSPADFAGRNFCELFSFEVVSRDSGWVQSQWEVVLAAAQVQPLTLRLKIGGAEAHECLVRIEQAGGAPAGYLAFITQPAPVSAAPAIAPAAAGQPDRENYLAILEQRSPLGFFDLNFLQGEVFYSPAWKRILGYADEELANTYETWLLLIHPDDSAAAPDRHSRGGAAGMRQYSIEFRMRHARGHYVWVQSVGTQIYSPAGALQRVVGVHLDIGDRKEFEDAGLRAEERLGLLGDRGRVGVFDLDFASGLHWLSPGFKSLLGYEAAEMPDTPESFLRALPKDETAGGLPGYFLAHHPNQVSYSETLRLRHREERDIVVHANIVRQISRRKELQRVLGFIVPLPEVAVSAPASAGDAPSPAHLAVLLSEMREGVLFADANGRILFLNRTAETLLGCTLHEALDQNAWDIFRLVHRENGLAGESPVARALTAGEATPLNDEFSLDTGGTEFKPVTYSAHPVVGAAGQPSGVVIVFRNPDAMSLTPEELVRANRFESLGQLAGGIAHDFNNLLTTILGGVSVAKENHDYEGLESSERACLAAKALAKQLLTFAKGGTSVRQVLNPADILAESVRLAGAGSTVTMELNVAPDTAAICVDRAQILQVFQNLIINAIQAMPAGKGAVRVSAGNATLAENQIAPLPAGSYVAVEVRDNGCGIPPENLARIFEPFFTTKKSGTGLGLATVLSIVKRHGGQMGVDTEVGVGTAFTIFLPQADKTPEVEARRAPTLRFGTGRVLFMDDDETIRTLTGGMLESLGYKYDLARDGEEAIQYYKRYLNIGRPYDVVIMDLTIIGGMGGELAFRQLRDLDPEVSAIMTSGYDNEEMARQFYEMGFLGYLTKPYRVGDLGRMLRKVLGK